jgi:TetR/AcrR family transcriptional regulator, transcriptional repressor for nem operon
MPRPAGFDRDTVLDAVMRSFWEHGYYATSLDRLEKATGLKRQSLYNAFGDKEAMFGAALERYRAEVGAPLRALLDSGDPAAAIRAYLDAHRQLLADPCTPSGCLIAGCASELGPRDDAVGARMRAEAEAATTALRMVFERWAAEGRLAASADPQTLAALLATIVRGLAMLARSGRDAAIIERAVEGALQALAPLLSPANPP